MAFIETPRFPDDVAQGAAGGPGYSTEVAVTFGGAESRNINWAAARGEWEVATGIKTAADYDAVLDFFRMCRGRAHGFRFKDWSDYAVAAPDGVLVLVSGSVYQMKRRYGSGATVEDRVITKPVQGTVTVTRTRAGVTTTIAPTINYTTGGVTVAGHVDGDVYAWAGEFDVPVRFDTDKLRTVLIGPARGGEDDRPLMSWESVPVIEIRVAEASA
jgi:uncharacterized protein (TIGR02217 family)